MVETKRRVIIISCLIGLIILILIFISLKPGKDHQTTSNKEDILLPSWDHSQCKYPYLLPSSLERFKPLIDYFDQIYKYGGYAKMQSDTLQLLDSLILMIEPNQEAIYHFTKAFLFYIRGDQFLEQLNSHEALNNLRISQTWLNRIAQPVEDSCFLHFQASLNNRFGLAYTNLYDLNNAVFHFERAIQLFRLTREEKELLANYSSLGLAYQNAGEFSLAIQWHKKAINIFKTQKDLNIKDTVNLAWIYNNLGIALGFKADSLDAIGAEHIAQEYLDRAIYQLGLSNKLTENNYSSDSDLLEAYAYVSMNTTAQFTKFPLSHAFDSIQYYTEKTLKVSLKVWDALPNIILAVLNRHLAYGYLQKGDCKQAGEHIDKALDLLKFKLPGQKESIIKNKDHYSDFLFSRAFILKKCGEQNPENTSHLKLSLQAYLEAIDFSEIVRQELTTDVSLEGFLRARTYQFVQAFEVAVQLFEKEKKEDYLQTAFQIAERSRSFTFRQGVSRQIKRWKEKNNSPFKKVLSFRKRITELERQISSDLSQKQNLKLYAALQTEKDAFSHFIEQLRTSSDPQEKNLYSNRLNNSVVTLRQIQDELLNEHTAVLEYLIGFGRIWCLTVIQDSIIISSNNVDSSFYKLIKLYKTSLSGEKSTFKKISEQLYQAFFKKTDQLLSEHGIKNIIVIPDKQLSGVLFDALLSHSNAADGNFENYPYLISKYNIGYHYSITGLLKNRELLRVRPRAANPFAGFTSELPDPKLNYASCGGVRLSNLEKLTEQTWKRFFNESQNGFFPAATVAEFKNKVGNYSIVQLSLHGCYERRAKPEFFLEFFPDTSMRNKHLELSEIYDLRLLTQLIVLSNCHTAQGSNVSGEGLMSVSRAFSYAGCPNTIAALSDIPDQPTSKILELFYEYLLEENTPPYIALAKAKRAYTKKYNHHPWMWNNLVSFGDLLPLDI